ncbi:hypothetical protein [Cellulomonas sp. P5_E12]
MSGSAGTPEEGWRRGSTTTPLEELAEHLLATASHHARTAIRDVSSANQFVLLDAAIHTGGAIEMVAKAAVAELEPLLLSSSGNSKGELLDALPKFRAATFTSAKRLRTIDASVAVAMVGRIHPACAALGTAATEALEIRNEAVHLGVVHPERLTEAVQAMASYINSVLGALDFPETMFWRSATSDAQVLQAERMRRLLSLARRRIYVAKKSLDLKLSIVPEADREHYMLQRERLRPVFEESAEAPCPACARSAALGWGIDVDVEKDHDGGFYTVVAGYTFEGLACPVCDLELKADEAEALGIDGTWQQPSAEDDFDPEWLAEFEAENEDLPG